MSAESSCPTCVRRGVFCAYCATLCTRELDKLAGICRCDCHVSDIEYEERIKAEKIGDLRKALKLEEK